MQSLLNILIHMNQNTPLTAGLLTGIIIKRYASVDKEEALRVPGTPVTGEKKPWNLPGC